MKNVIVLYFGLLIGQLIGQSKYDTLVIASKKYPLQKTTIFHNSSQDGTVLLPSEYKEFDRQVLFKYKNNVDTIVEVLNDEEGNQIQLSRLSDKSYLKDSSELYLHSIVDTLEVKVEQFSSLNPFIKSGTKKIYFCSGKIILINGNKMKTVIHSYKSDKNIFSYWTYDLSYSALDLNKKGIVGGAVLILKDLYYKKGNATYYLDREFVIIFK